jgi:hypothetical protein
MAKPFPAGIFGTNHELCEETFDRGGAFVSHASIMGNATEIVKGNQ